MDAVEPGPYPRNAMPPSDSSGTFQVDARLCIRCASSRSTAPDLFTVQDGTAQVLRQPRTAEELVLARRAVILCPTGALTEATE